MVISRSAFSRGEDSAVMLPRSDFTAASLRRQAGPLRAADFHAKNLHNF